MFSNSQFCQTMKGGRRQSECIFDKMQLWKFVISKTKQTSHVWFRLILTLIWLYNYLHHSHEKMFLIRIATKEYRSTRYIFWWTNETSFFLFLQYMYRHVLFATVRTGRPKFDILPLAAQFYDCNADILVRMENWLAKGRSEATWFILE